MELRVANLSRLYIKSEFHRDVMMVVVGGDCIILGI